LLFSPDGVNELSTVASKIEITDVTVNAMIAINNPIDGQPIA